MIIETHSDDLGVLGKEANPACAHLKNGAGEYLGKFAVTQQSPQSIEHVIDLDKSNPIPLKYKEMIVEWA